jgi:hypothetical protein
LNGKIKNYKNFEKKIKEKNKESRVEGLNWKYRGSDMIVKLNFTWVLGSDKVARPKLLNLSIKGLNWKYRESEMTVKLNFAWVLGFDKVTRPKSPDLSSSSVWISVIKFKMLGFGMIFIILTFNYHYHNDIYYFWIGH